MIRSSVAAAIAMATIVACGAQEAPPKAPTPPPSPPDPPALAQVAQACVKLVSCTSRPQSAHLRDPSACVDWWLGSFDPKSPDPLKECLIKARSCADTQFCLRGAGDGKAAAFCGKGGVVSGCDGDRLVSCEDDAHESSVVDCAAMGATCRETKAPGGVVVRACMSPAKCPPGAPEMRCDGPSTIISCREGGFERIDCRAGTTCEERRDENGDPFASCELPGRRRCDVRHCEDGRLVDCERVGRTKRPRVTDCAAFGLQCAGVGPRAGCTVPADVECDREMLARCDGEALVFCAAGRKQRAACTGLGACVQRGSLAACGSSPTAR